jgi:hypothetical protein
MRYFAIILILIMHNIMVLSCAFMLYCSSVSESLLLKIVSFSYSFVMFLAWHKMGGYQLYCPNYIRAKFLHKNIEN